ncbi:MAG: hypothetical protein ACK4FL_04200, partial [Microgenomates group bacterium]
PRWDRALGVTKKPEDQVAEFLRGKKVEGKKEFIASDEAVEITKLSLVKALFLNLEAGNFSQYKDAPFAQVASIILNEEFLKAEGIDMAKMPQDFEKRKEFFEDLVERFYRKFPEQALTLGTYFAAYEWKIIRSVYDIQFRVEEGKEIIFPDPSFTTAIKKVEQDSDGRIRVIFTI